MAKDILEEIIIKRKEDMEIQKNLISLAYGPDLDSQLAAARYEWFIKYFSFKDRIIDNLRKDKISIIGEIKKASPSAGILIEDYAAKKIALHYQIKKITCLSVLTEPNYFMGDMNDMRQIKLDDRISLPILCKDFFVDEFHVRLARINGADAILIILAAVSDDLANKLYKEAMNLKMDVIVEVHTVEEAKRALKFKNAFIGINNRNLKTLETEINTTYDIHDVLINHPCPLISESGIKTKDELLEISNKTSIKTFLIGESLLKDLDNNSIFSVL